MTTDIAGYQLAVLKWTLPPDEIDFAVRCYQETEKILKNKRTTRKRLLEVYQAHLQLLLFREAISDSRRQELWNIAQQQRKNIIHALVYRVNCKNLRFIAALIPCPAICCCNCAANYPDIACIKDLTI